MLKTLTWLKLTLLYTTHEAASVKVNNQLHIFTLQAVWWIQEKKKKESKYYNICVSVHQHRISNSMLSEEGYAV